MAHLRVARHSFPVEAQKVGGRERLDLRGVGEGREVGEVAAEAPGVVVEHAARAEERLLGLVAGGWWRGMRMRMGWLWSWWRWVWW